MDMKDLTLTKSEEEEDDKMMLLILPALHPASARTKTPCHTSKLSRVEYIELLEGHRSRCYNNLRMEPHIFQALLDYLRPKNLLKNTRGVTVEEQLVMFMYMLAQNTSFRVLTDIFQHNVETVHKHLGACFEAITSLTYEFVKPPSTETHWKISSRPQFWPYFENYLGAIDGTYVPITITDSEAASYRNRK